MKLIIFLYVLMTLSSCSLIRKKAIGVTSEVALKGSDEIFTDGNLTLLEKAIPGNIKFMEGLWYVDKENENLLTLLIKSYAGYSYGILEADATKEILLDEKGVMTLRAIEGYEKAIFYGEKLLNLKGISLKQFYNKDFPNKLKRVFDDQLDEQDLVGVLYFAQALGSSINLQRENIAKMANLNHVKGMLDYVCSRSPQIEGGNCALFQAVIEASTPTLLGGDPKTSQKMFLKLMREYPQNLLVRSSYIQYHLIPMYKEQEFKEEMLKLKGETELWYKTQIGQINNKNKIYKKMKRFNFYNALAMKKYEIIRSIKNELF